MANTLNDLSQQELDRATDMLKAIAHPMRLTIISHLEDGKMMTVTSIHELLEIEQSTTSHHLGILKDKGVLGAKRKGKNTYYYLRHDNLSHLIECIRECAKPLF